MGLLEKYVPSLARMFTKVAVLYCRKCKDDGVVYRRGMPRGWWPHDFEKEIPSTCNGEGGHQEKCWAQEYKCQRCLSVRRWGFSEGPIAAHFN